TLDAADLALEAAVLEACRDQLPREFEAFNFSAGLEAWMKAVFACNQYVDEQAPWTLRKTDPERMKAVLMTLFRQVHALAIAVRPVVPTSIDHLLDQMGIPGPERDFAALDDGGWFERLVASGHVLSQPQGVFPRLEMPQDEPA
ncbi:MAG: methionine--tRNA ligase, partial [Erythrobacter sp.]